MQSWTQSNQVRRQAGYRSGYSTSDHIYVFNQVVEKYAEHTIVLTRDFCYLLEEFIVSVHCLRWGSMNKTNYSFTRVLLELDVNCIHVFY